MPEAATVEDIEKIYIEGWKLGLKAIAIYRDGSKRSQPLSTTKLGDAVVPSSAEVEQLKKQIDGLHAQIEAMQNNRRRKLSNDRSAVTHKFAIGGHDGYLTVGLYEDGTPGEIFLRMSKEGSTLSGLMDAFATSISIGLQYGVPLADLVSKFSHMRFEPNGFTGNSEIPIAKSIIDYIFRWLGARFLGDEASLAMGNHPISLGNGFSTGLSDSSGQPEMSVTLSTDTFTAKPALASNNSKAKFSNADDAPPCSDCGSLTIRSGSCYVCTSCGTTTGCS
jgi:ribonucleoside-diphosphate reductase alpha chain